MADAPSRAPRTIWVGFLLFFLIFALAFALWLFQTIRKFDHPPLQVIGTVAPFNLTNQDFQNISLTDFTNRVWIADIIFTRCAGPCPRMTGQMKSLQDALPRESAAKLVTLTTDPEFDTPEVLKKYAQRAGADSNRWTFLTGTKGEIAQLAANSLKLSAQPIQLDQQKDSADLFIHTTIFVIVDKRGQLRGFFETDGVDWTNSVLPQIIKSVRYLENEP